MYKSIKVFIICNGKEIEESRIKYNSKDTKLTLLNDSLGCIECIGGDFLDALTSIRLELENNNCILLINGSRKNFVVSGMSNQMSGGIKGYTVKLGEPATRDNLVDILAYAEPNLVGTIEEQDKFYQEWMESILNR